jgi:[acyl-carrier-protein] S-malonyltransferase
MKNSNTVLLFPGQGSQYVGMGKDLWSQFAQARETFEEAGDALGEDMVELCFEGPEERLRLTENTQPAILTVSVAVWRVLRSETSLHPRCAAGHSLGEYAALTAAGVLAFGEAIKVVRQRGRFMQEAVPPGSGAMAALLGLDAEEVARLCRELRGEGIVEPANFNAPGQVVISGHAAAVEEVSRLAGDRGARKVLPLPVSAPFHSPLMVPAGERLAGELGRLQIGEFEFPVISNVEAAPYPGPDRVVELLTRQVSHPVRWQESMEAVAQMGVDLAVELGPKRVLAGLMKRIVPEVETAQVEDRTGLQKVMTLIQ